MAESPKKLDSHVKSTAVVKYAAMDVLAQFRQLQQNTDLKQPPANWLQGNSKWESYVRDVSFGKGQVFSSFKIGHCYPDLTGEIDVVSDAENIKKLLKIPYSKSHVSMMVHRVGNTLLLDDFDIHRHLLRQQQKDWLWLRKFYYETVVQDMQSGIKDQMKMVKKKKSRDHLRNRNMFSKFLYYSIGKSEDADVATEDSAEGRDQEAALRASAPPLPPDPLPQSETYRPVHQRTQEWTFEDIRMLVGTDLPIFGGGTHPCISLRLRDMHEPINVLTGLDYWLDNLICNVPELAMCYHIDGIVQSYNLLKTEEIPKMPKSEFSPAVIKDVAQNILSFLKSNATKEGHTYWLFKGHGDDVVKLYDLSTLCADIQDDGGVTNNNPFTVPVGMLLYRVARNMRARYGRKKSGTIRTLLHKCLLLLDAERHAQVVTSAQFLLADLYISDSVTSPVDTSDTDTSDTESDAEDVTDSYAEGDSSQTAPVTSVDVQTLCLPEKVQKSDRRRQEVVRHPPVSGGQTDRCTEALRHVAMGLQSLDSNIRSLEDAKTSTGSPSRMEPETQAQCNPNTAIPMHYTPLKTDLRTTGSEDDTIGPRWDSEDQTTQLSVFKQKHLLRGSWHHRSKSLLLRKATVAYYGLAEAQLAAKKYSLSRKHILMALRSYSCLRVLSSPPDPDPALSESLLGLLLSLAGDIHLLMAHSPQGGAAPDTGCDEAEVPGEAEITASCHLIQLESEFSWLEPPCAGVEPNLERSCRCYQQALDSLPLTPADVTAKELSGSVGKRLGNILNELGVHYMNTAANRVPGNNNSQDRGGCAPAPDSLIRQSEECFLRGVRQFQALGDRLNVSLLYSNLGRLQRVSAQIARRDLDPGGLEFSPGEAQAFSKAQEYYQSALTSLDDAANVTADHRHIRDSVVWELSSTCFTMATLLQDHAPLSTKAQEQVELEVVRLMEKALGLCEELSGDEDSPRHAVCVYRAATIHHRLASLHHNAYRNQIDDKKSRYLRTTAEKHYTRAAEMFAHTEGSCEILRVQLERVALYEYQFNNLTSPITRLRTLHSALTALVESRSAVDLLSQQVAEQDRAVSGESRTVSAEDHTVSGADRTESEQDGANSKHRESQDREGLRDEGGKLLGIFVGRLQALTLNLVKVASKRGGAPVAVDTYKSVYAAVLKSGADDGRRDLVERCRRLVDTLETVAELVPAAEGTRTQQQHSPGVADSRSVTAKKR